MIELPKKYMVQAGLYRNDRLGSVSAGGYNRTRVEIDALISALCIATMSHILARVLKAPVSNFFDTGYTSYSSRWFNIQMCVCIYKRVFISQYIYE